MLKITKNIAVQLLIILSEILIFGIDLITPLGTIEWIYYLLPIMFAAWRLSSFFSFLNITLCTLFIAASLLVAPSGTGNIIAVYNCALGTIVLWIIYVILIKYRKAEKILKEKEIVERTALELQHINLKLEELNASKDKFFSIISHDLRSPFTALLGFSEFLSKNIDELSSEEIKEFSGRIYNSLNNLLKLIENLLQWSQIQTGRMHSSPASFNLNDLFDEIQNIFQINSVVKKVKFNHVINDNLFLFADKNMISTVLRNLLSNAFKFTPEGGTVTISAKVCSRYIEIEISDTGIGIPRENIPKLFKVGENIVTAGLNKEKGTGLGLILCKELVEMNKGEIRVESIPGLGTKFIMLIPGAID